MDKDTTSRLILTDSDIYSYGIKRGFPENPELSLVRDGAWKAFVASFSEEPQEDPSLASPEEGSAEEQTEQKEEEATAGDKDIISAYLEENPGQKTVLDHIVASAMYPQNVVYLFAEIAGNQFRMRAAQPVQGGPDTAYATLVRAGTQQNLPGVESPEGIRNLVRELAGVNAETSAASYPCLPLAQFVLLAACDLVRENVIEGGRFTPSAIMNAFSFNGEKNFARFCAPLAELAGDRLSSCISIEDMERLVEELTSQGVFIKEKAGDRAAYTFGSGFRSLPELFSGSDNRFAWFCRDTEGKGNLIYIISENDISWAFVVNNQEGRIERINKESFENLLSQVFPRSAFCTNCGTPLPSGAHFCEECGTKAE